MSKTKEIISIEYTLKDVLRNLSDQDIQEITGKSKSYIYKCADPDDHDRHIHFKDVIALEHAMNQFFQKTPFSNFLKDHLTTTASPVKPGSEHEVLSEVMGIGGRVGDLMDSIHDSMDEKSSGGSKIVPHEKELIYQEIQKIDDQLSKIKSVLKSL
ncbi:hypothetical protein N9M32_01305 [Alphaproteobacteria bacterium]|nr:hypothetical protein [Alphaproteobacteria bacterium]